MVTFNLLVFVCVLYVILLFLVAFAAEKRAEQGRLGWLRSPLVYTLSLSIYCTAWTFYGAVGYAARSGLEFVTIYLGPTLVMVGWWWVVRKLVRIGRSQRITSIADLISSRYGKSNLLGVIVTLMAVVGSTPYIALQLQSVTLSFAVFASDRPEGWAVPDLNSTAIWVAAGLALFTILFGTRNLDANERHHGVVTAIALEAVVKLVALACGRHLRGLGRGGGADGHAGADRGFADCGLAVERRSMGDADLPVGGGLSMPAADVSGAGGGKLGRTPCGDGKLGVPALPISDEPVRGTNCRCGIVGIAGGNQSGPVRADSAAAL